MGGCYRSHERMTDGAVPPVDAGAACEVSFTHFSGTHVECSIPASSTEGCAEAAVCFCSAIEPGTPTEVLRCAGWDLTPRGALTFTDFCPLEPPERLSMGDVFRAFLMGADDLEISSTCDQVPGLIGTRPYAACGSLVEQVCGCGPSPCDLDARLGRSCLSFTIEQAQCISANIGFNNPCSADLAAVIRSCGG
jgi:hypothetical protein